MYCLPFAEDIRDYVAIFQYGSSELQYLSKAVFLNYGNFRMDGLQFSKLLSQHAEKLWELKSTHLIIAKVEKHWSGIFYVP